MCGRYYADREFIPRLATLFEEEEIVTDEGFSFDGGHGAGSAAGGIHDICPDDNAVIIMSGDGKLKAARMKWGFRDDFHNSMVINARAETADSKPMFSESLKERRCLIPASGFYEWNASKTKYRFTGGGLMFLAGIYRQENGEDHYTILTTDANDSMRPVHNRMPVMIDRSEIRAWLTDGEMTKPLLERTQKELEKTSCSGQIELELPV